MTSTSTPGSRLMEVYNATYQPTDSKSPRTEELTICLTISEDEWRSIKRLWILSS